MGTGVLLKMLEWNDRILLTTPDDGLNTQPQWIMWEANYAGDTDKRQEVKDITLLIKNAVNSYHKNCGERAAACAEGDLLDVLLTALRFIIKTADDAWDREDAKNRRESGNGSSPARDNFQAISGTARAAIECI